MGKGNFVKTAIQSSTAKKKLKKQAPIKILRVVIALVVWCLITILFTFFASGFSATSSFILKTQFVPSLLSAATGGLIAFILLMLITLLFGRIYCSFLCPLGIFQDIITRFASLFKTRKQKKTKFVQPHNILRYTILFVVTISLIFGTVFPLLALDPYSNYGRIVSHLFNPMLAWINNGPAGFTLSSFCFSLLFFIVIAIFSAFKGRLYCNTICPVGSFLGLISKVSAFRLVIDNEACVGCHQCSANCKSGCIDGDKRIIDMSRCVTCFDCIGICHGKAIKYQYSWGKNSEANKKEDSQEINKSRRNAIAAIGAVGAVVASRSLAKAKIAEPVKAKKAGGIVPPGGLSISHLMDNCTACHACVMACPNEIIKPAVLQYGLEGFMLPTLSFEKGFCSYDCHKCSDVCPNAALLPMSLEKKRITKLGQVKFIAGNCLVFKLKDNCGLCSEHCPTNAIKMKDWKGQKGVKFPYLEKEYCIGCGGCENACPATPKAMVVEPFDTHKEAKAANL